MKDEVFKNIKQTNTYSVSNYGRIKNNKRNTIRTPGTLNYYKIISLWYNGKANDHRVHRLVAENFLENLENKPEVNHKNGIRNDNRSKNLEWVTSEENVKHKKEQLNQGDVFKGSRNGNSKLKKDDIINIRNSKKNIKELSNIYLVTTQCITKIIKKQTWKHI